jgi:iron complex outermembrane recepter protein
MAAAAWGGARRNKGGARGGIVRRQRGSPCSVVDLIDCWSRHRQGVNLEMARGKAMKSCWDRRCRDLIVVAIIIGPLCGALILPAAASEAQQSNPQPSAAATGPVEGAGLEEVVVTARKRNESLQTVPVSVTEFSAQDIQQRGMSSLESIAGNIPSLYIGRTSNGSGAQITLRGVGSQSSSIGIAPSTAVVVDDVYYGSGFFLNEGLFDMQNMQVLEGPQALFFGKNATAGVIAMTTMDPTDKFEAQVREGYEVTSQDLQGDVILSGPITDNLVGRIAARVSNMYGGYFTNDATGTPITFKDIATGVSTQRYQEPDSSGQPGTYDRAGRVTLIWTPLDQLTAKLKMSAERREDASNAWNYVPFACPFGYTQPNHAIQCGRNFTVYVPDAPDGIGGNIPYSHENGAPYNLYESRSFTLDLEYKLQNATISSVSNYNWLTNLWALSQNVPSPTTVIAATQDSSLGATSNETRFQTSFSGPVNFMVGEYYQKTSRLNNQAGVISPLENSSAPPGYQFLSYFKPSTTDGDTISEFAQLTWRVVPQVELAAGARHIHETYDSFLVQSYVIPTLQSRFPQDKPITADQTFDHWTPEATISYYPQDNLTFYAAYKTAYKSGGFSNSSLITSITKPSDVAFSPETASGYDAGVKSTLFDNQLRLNVDLYRTKYTNLQINYFNSITFDYITTNAGESLVEGVELTSEYAPLAVPELRLNASVNYNRARYTQYIGPCYTGQSIAAGCNTTFDGGPGQNLSGQPLAVAPDWTASFGATYQKNLGSGLVVSLSPYVRYSGSYLGSGFGAPLSRQPAFAVFDTTVAIRTEDDRWELAAIGRNLTNTFYISAENDLPNSGSGTGTKTAVPADQIGIANLPRTILIQLTHRF